MKTIPPISKYMTTVPRTIGAKQTLSEASAMMSEFKIRHLPVMQGGKLVGILTDRDVQLVGSFSDVSPETTSVEAAFTPNPYVAKPSASLAEVCAEMASRKYGCVLVCDNGQLVGIFTWIDALKAFNDLLERFFVKSPER